MTVRFALFLARSYEASGGWDDLYGIYDSFDVAISEAKNETHGHDYEYGQIVNLETLNWWRLELRNNEVHVKQMVEPTFCMERNGKDQIGQIYQDSHAHI